MRPLWADNSRWFSLSSWGLFMDTWVWWCYCDCEMLWFQLLQVKVMLFFQLVCFSCWQTCTFVFSPFHMSIKLVLFNFNVIAPYRALSQTLITHTYILQPQYILWIIPVIVSTMCVFIMYLSVTLCLPLWCHGLIIHLNLRGPVRPLKHTAVT